MIYQDDRCRFFLFVSNSNGVNSNINPISKLLTNDKVSNSNGVNSNQGEYYFIYQDEGFKLQRSKF